MPHQMTPEFILWATFLPSHPLGSFIIFHRLLYPISRSWTSLDPLHWDISSVNVCLTLCHQECNIWILTATTRLQKLKISCLLKMGFVNAWKISPKSTEWARVGEWYANWCQEHVGQSPYCLQQTMALHLHLQPMDGTDHITQEPNKSSTGPFPRKSPLTESQNQHGTHI